MTEFYRLESLQEANLWIGTPYRHQASVRGMGTDCLGLIRGIYRKLYGCEPLRIPPYSPDWAERGRDEIMLTAAGQYLTEINMDKAMAGDVLVFRLAPGRLAKHCAILSTSDSMIHAWQGHMVCETAFDKRWQRRLAGVFAFPKR